jgi:putative sterol carrier protein
MIRALAWLANVTPEARELLEGWDAIVQFDLGDAEFFYLQAENGIASFFNGKNEKPDVIIKSDSKTFTKVLTGKVDSQEAYIFHSYEIEGSIMDGAKFKRLGEIVRDRYKEIFAFVKFFVR